MTPNPNSKFKEKNKQNPKEMSLKYSPLPGSKKGYQAGELYPDIRVPYRQITLSDTQLDGRNMSNEPFNVYDCSGIYTDSDVTIDISKGLPQIREKWIDDRGDVKQLEGQNSAYFYTRKNDSSLDAIRFPTPKKPRQAKAGKTVTQMHYDRTGVITPEMEYIDIRETCRPEFVRD